MGLAWDSQGRLYFSSDATGEIYVVVREDGGKADDASPTSGLPEGGPSPTESAPSGGSTTAAASKVEMGLGMGFAWAGFVALGLV